MQLIGEIPSGNSLRAREESLGGETRGEGSQSEALQGGVLEDKVLDCGVLEAKIQEINFKDKDPCRRSLEGKVPGCGICEEATAAKILEGDAPAWQNSLSMTGKS